MSFWSEAGSSRLFSAFAPDSALHSSSLLEGIISCSTAASNTAFHHLLCQSATGVLKDAGIALERRWTQKGTQNRHEFGDTWKMRLAVPQQEQRGTGRMRHCWLDLLGASKGWGRSRLGIFNSLEKLLF